MPAATSPVHVKSCIVHIPDFIDGAICLLQALSGETRERVT